MIDVLGWIGGIFFTLCGAPLAYRCYIDGHARGLSTSFLYMWLGGEFFMHTYILLKHGLDLPLLIDHWASFIFLGVIFFYKYYERKEK